MAQAPAPAAVLNPASNIPAGLPNSGIAQGSIIVVYGANLGPSTLVQATSLPLPTTSGLGGTTVTVTVNGTTLTAPMIYTLSTQVAAILPSAIPLGTGTLTVKYNGASGSTPITVVPSNFGMSTVNQTGTGPVVVTFLDYSLVTSSSSAKPGDVLTLWGTGLGATTGSDATLPVQTDLGTPIQIFVGGVQANILYRGRSASPGLDQINFVVPQGVSGCAVSLGALTNGTIVSNYTSIAVAATGGACSYPGASTSTFTSVPSQSSVRLGYLDLEWNDNVGGIADNDVITAGAAFLNFTQSQFASFSSGLSGLGGTGLSPGQCTVSYTNLNQTLNATYLNAGASVVLTSPSGSTTTLSALPNGGYGATLTTEPAGSYTLSGNGGADVGAFTAGFSLAQPITWTNPASVGTINRSQPLTITWTGGDANAYADIAVGSSGPGYDVSLDCSATASLGQFTIPPALLLALPPGHGDLTVASGTNPQFVSVPGFYLFSVFASRPAFSILTTIQ